MEYPRQVETREYYWRGKHYDHWPFKEMEAYEDARIDAWEQERANKRLEQEEDR
jgi:hypothetical protein